ncbi:MAG: BrnA antitoxin family protein [Thermodesulfobacteriota bacterium]
MKKEYDFTKGKRGPVVPPVPNKTRITIRLDNDIINWFKNKVHEAGGGNYQSMINEALHKYIEAEREPIEQVLRRVVREELHRDSASPR